MGRQKQDGRGRLGGRKKGTPNKMTGELKDWISDVLDNNRRQFEEDLKMLLPFERVRVLSSMFGYVIPKQQSLTIQQLIDKDTQSLINFFKEAPDDAIDQIAAKVLELQEKNKTQGGK